MAGTAPLGGRRPGAAAAVAAGVVPIATGADGAGSVRIPAAFCGVVGFKGSYGRVPRPAGRSRTQRIVTGVIGARLADVVLATSLASGLHPRRSDRAAALAGAGRPGRRLAVAYSPDLGFAHPDPGVADIVRERVTALAAAGAADLANVAVRLADPAPGWLPLAALENGELTDVTVLERAYELRRHNDAILADAFTKIDVLVTPTTPETAFGIGDYEANLPAGDLCWAFNLSGHPAVTVPAGLLRGLPVGLQAVAAPHRDDLALAFAGLAQVCLPDPPVRWRLASREVLREQRPALVVAPVPADLQVAAGEALLLEAEAADQADGAGVAGLDVRLHPVQAAGRRTPMPSTARRPLGHQAAPGVRGEGAVAQELPTAGPPRTMLLTFTTPTRPPQARCRIR